MTTADLVFTRGPVFTADPARSRATSLAVVGDRIAAVGHDDVREFIGPGTEVVDLTGKLLLPGFQDAHIHPVYAGVELAECDLTGTVGVDEYLALIRTYADAHPDHAWITGGGWSMESFDGGLPTRQLLDSVVPDRPVLLANRDHHGAWANTRALELAGITAATPTPSTVASSASRTVRPAGCSRKAPRRWSPGWCRRPPPRTGSRVCCARRSCCTPRHHRLAGCPARCVHRQGRSVGRLSGRRPRRLAHRPGHRRAVVGPRAWRRADRRTGRAARS